MGGRALYSPTENSQSPLCALPWVWAKAKFGDFKANLTHQETITDCPTGISKGLDFSSLGKVWVAAATHPPPLSIAPYGLHIPTSDPLLFLFIPMKDLPLSHWCSIQFLPLFVALLGYVLILGFAKPAEARMRFCNHSGQKLAVSWAWKDTDNDWKSESSYIYDPGECSNVYSSPLRSRIYYYYAKAVSGGTTHGASTGANRSFCVSNRSFDIVYDGTNVPYYDLNHKAAGWKSTCSALGEGTDYVYQLRDFRQINTGRFGFRCTVYLEQNGRSSYDC
ncbi:MAG: DUF1036 domain-containing protein [Synechococcus sp. SB0662_bin_14]|nr:DUF1036 domain-containing protein [Synechococcus sp. SB0662_bin_14]